MQPIIDLLNSLWGAPSFGLVGLACLIFGYVLRVAKVPKPWIVWTIILVLGPALNLMLAEVRSGDEPLRHWWAENYVVGAGIGFLVWLVHKTLINRIEHSVPVLGGLLARASTDAPSVPPVEPPISKTP